MELDIAIHKGLKDSPVVILIHGLGMHRGFWTNPCEARVLASNISVGMLAARKPVSRSLTDKRSGDLRGLTAGIVPGSINNLWSALADRGLNLICWSQRRPAGPIMESVRELEYIVSLAGAVFPGRGIVLTGHSRGGLIARKFMERSVSGIRALITIATPHRGSRLSCISKYLGPVAPFLLKVLPVHTHGSAADILKRANDLLRGDALRELMPGSEFFANLNDTRHDNIRYLSFGGKKTALMTLYRWKRCRDRISPAPLVTVPDSLIRILPARVVPDELINGRRDFMVTAESSVMPWSEDHYDVKANHVSITWNRKVLAKITELIEEVG